MIQFSVDFRKSTETSQTVFYREEDFAFDTVPAAVSTFTSILLDDVNLEVDEIGKVIAIWGLCPHTMWKEAILIPPAVPAGELLVQNDLPLEQGVSIRISLAGKHLATYLDKNNGWVKIEHKCEVEMSVHILPNVIVDLGPDREIAQLWIKPIFE
ncbi:MAG TPA: hypothetical protein VFP12_03580 [Allosphingosinicella sp.]|nr:hypothetical protein [Allosphingosinicella sp.]